MTNAKNCSFAQIMHGLQHKRMKVDPPNTEKVNSLDKNFGRRTFNYTGRWLSARMKQDITLSQKKKSFQILKIQSFDLSNPW